MKDIAYFDNSATTRPLDEVLLYMEEINKEYYGNPSSLHILGIEAEKKVYEARKQVSLATGALPGEIYFTSGGTESNNIAITGYLSANRPKSGGGKVVFSSIEHPSVYAQADYLKKQGYTVIFAEVDTNCRIDTNKLEHILDEDVELVSVMHVNNETGSIQPISEIRQIMDYKSPDSALHVDAVQSYCKLKINPENAGIDLLTGSAHKIHGPKGIGFIYINKKKNIKVNPIIYGGGQENGIKSGTENVPGIAGFGKATEILSGAVDSNFDSVMRLNRYLRGIINERLPKAVFISPENALPHILCVSFPGLKGEVILHKLEADGVFVSTGSACSSRNRRRSHVLNAMGLKPEVIDGALRISFSCLSTKEDTDKLAESLINAVGSFKI